MNVWEVRDQTMIGRKRPRRLRQHPSLRSMIRESSLSVADLVYPMFVVHGTDRQEAITSMPGISRLSVDRAVDEVREVRDLGIPAVLIFGIPESKDPMGSEAYADDGIVQTAIRRIKERVPETLVITDTCLCEYTDHGHCGIVSTQGGQSKGYLLNDDTLDVLERTAVSQAAAGADMVAPSGMIDGMVAAIRRALDEARYEHIAIMSYAAKYASALYGPFREAADGAPSWGDRRSHQMDPANAAEAMKEITLDVEEGADIVMVKPALPYLDVVRRAKQGFPEIPLAAYHVSGEYAMIKAAASNGWIDERSVTLEILTSSKRAGADILITYQAKDVARWLRGDA